MDAVEYIKELSRMCQYYTERKKCDISCPFDFFCQNARYRDAKNAEAMVNAVENWREEHPPKTNLQKFEEVFGKFNNIFVMTQTKKPVWWDEEYSEGKQW